jgi:acyl-CoA oxidase
MSLNKAQLNSLSDSIYGAWAESKKATRSEILKPVYRIDDSLPYKAKREKVLDALKALAAEKFTKAGFPASLGGELNPGAGMSIFEELIFSDASLQIKYGVQFGLFGSAILHLGTNYHHEEFLPGVVSLKTPGSFAMTEIGHGSDVANIETTATYDPSTQEFVINTPTRTAWKDYIGNAAKHGKAAVVFAQLIVNGESQGVHAFYVPIRGGIFNSLLPGVQSEDDGHKGGLNGIDNGRLAFDNVRIPRKNLLNKYADVSPEGVYTSSIESKGKRFFTMLSTLVQGRVSLVGAVTNAEKLALTIAIRYAHKRSQFKGSHGVEQHLIDYQTHQERLYTKLATLYGSIGMHQSLAELFHKVFEGNATEEEKTLLETDAAAAKSLSTWNALASIQAAREACGGQGFLTENKLVQLRKDLDVYATFEGDNHVLLQLVSRRLISDYAEKMKHPNLADTIHYLVNRVMDRVGTTAMPVIAQNFKDLVSHGENDLESILENGEAFLARKVEILTEQIALAFKEGKEKGNSPDSTFNANQTNIVELGLAYGNLLHYRGYGKLIAANQESSQIVELISSLRSIHLITLLEKDALFFTSHSVLSPQRITLLSQFKKNNLFAKIRSFDLDLVAAFDIHEELIGAPIANYSY